MSIDIKNIKELFQDILIKETLGLEQGETFDDKLERRLSHLPTKDEFYKEMDKITGKLNTVRLEQKTSANILSRHSNQIDTLNKIHPQGKHLAL